MKPAALLPIALTLAASATAQGPALLKKVARTADYEEFSLTIKEVTHNTRKLFELYETPIPSTADTDVVQNYRLLVRGNTARTESRVGGATDGTDYTAVFDGEKTLDFRLLRTLPNGGTVIDATEDRRNTLRWGPWRAFGRDDATLRPWWKIPGAVRSAVEKGGEIVVRRNVPGTSLIRLDAKPPHTYLGETYLNEMGKAGNETTVTKRFADGFPKEIRTTMTILGERVAWTTSTVIKRGSGPLDPALFRVTPAPGSRIVDNAADAIYRIGPKGERTKIGRVSGGSDEGTEDLSVSRQASPGGPTDAPSSCHRAVYGRAPFGYRLMRRANSIRVPSSRLWR